MPPLPTVTPIVNALATETLHALEPEALKVLSDLFGALSAHFDHALETHPATKTGS